MNVLNATKLPPAAAASKVVHYALMNYNRSFDAIEGEDQECWLWEAQDAVNAMNEWDKEYRYEYRNQILSKERK